MQLFAVIPTFVLAGPLAILAALCPAAFAGLALTWRRWGVLLGIASVNSSLYLGYSWIRSSAREAAGWTPQALWLSMAAVACIGAVFSYWRARRAMRAEEMVVPGRFDLAVLATASVVGLGVFLYALSTRSGLRGPWREWMPVCATVWIGMLFLLYRRVRRSDDRSAITAQTAMLMGLGASCAWTGFTVGPRPNAQIAWTFEAPDRGMILSTPLVAGERLYVSAAHATALKQFGALYCLDRRTGKKLWAFNRDGRMKQVLSSPALAEGRVYVGEGLHEDTDCGLYCLDAGTGAEVWAFPTRSHTESSPRVAGGCVFFGAGDDGVYCLHSADGALKWQFPGVHVDATPALHEGRLYAGSGYGRSEMFCLDSATGKPIWRTPSELSVFGSPAIADGQVFFGVGNGKLTHSGPKAAGALVCLDTATGAKQWRYDVADAVLCTPAVATEHVYFGARDGHCYCLDRRDGRLRWQTDLGSPVVASPLLADTRLYAIGSAGGVYCLDAGTGLILWRFDAARYSGTTPELLARPGFARDDADTGPRLYLGAGLHYSINLAAVVYCLKTPAESE